MHVPPGEKIEGRYTVDAPLPLESIDFDSAPSQLYSATDEQLERPVTVQLLCSDEAQRRATFLRHGQLAASIHHPHIAGVYDAGEWQGRPYWIMSRAGADPVSSVHNAKAPDVDRALDITRKAAVALQIVRDAGLSDWTFSHQAVRLTPDGDLCLLLVEGLDAQTGPGARFTSNSHATDPQALAAMLRLMLLGSVEPQADSAEMAALPAPVLALLARMEAGDSLPDSASAAVEVGGVQASAMQATEAYVPVAPAGEAAVEPYYGPADVQGEDTPDPNAPRPAVVDYHEAPTLVEPVGVAAATTAALYSAASPNEPAPSGASDIKATAPLPVPAYAAPATNTRRRRVPVALPLLAVLLLAGALLAVLWPRHAAEASPPSQSVAPAAALVSVPDVRGKSLDDATRLLEGAGLHAAQGQPVRDANLPVNVVTDQQPGPASSVASSSTITLTLNLAPEPAPTATHAAAAPKPTQAAPVVQQKQQPASAPAQQSKPAPQPKQEPQPKHDPPGKKKKDK